MKTGFKTSSLLFWLMWIFITLCSIFLTRYIIATVFTETHINSIDEMTTYTVPAGPAKMEINIDSGDEVVADPDTVSVMVTVEETEADSITVNGIKVKAYKSEKKYERVNED
ncbi:MAG: hypothetical protein K2M04_07870 [Muribaculaceae bacterium]|nr:hypothetical protein [Muribaculaceae bacterium]